jgi:hypothetical protein
MVSLCPMYPPQVHICCQRDRSPHRLPAHLRAQSCWHTSSQKPQEQRGEGTAPLQPTSTCPPCSSHDDCGKGGVCVSHHDARTTVSISQTARPPPASNLGCAGTDRHQPTSFLAKARSNGNWILIPGPTWSSLSSSRSRMTRSEARLLAIPYRHACLMRNTSQLL